MFTRILIPTDGSELSQQAVLAGMTLASKLGAEVIGLSVMPRFHTVSLDPDMLEDTAERFRQSAQARADDDLAFVSKAAADAGVSSTVETGTSDDPWQAIIDTAHAHACDLVVMASHGRKGWKGLLLGSETQKVLVNSTIPVLVYR
ncbi:universal stress protein [Massilia sp. PWRC2]|uniref:universal stress protein n=1 Tax=Massilia sp. PWRC2 TaxID=2804626 RepID=UPI003CF4DABB